MRDHVPPRVEVDSRIRRVWVGWMVRYVCAAMRPNQPVGVRISSNDGGEELTCADNNYFWHREK